MTAFPISPRHATTERGLPANFGIHPRKFCRLHRASCSAPGPTESSPLRDTGDALGNLKRVVDKEKTRLSKPRRTTVNFWLSAHEEEQWAEDYYGHNSCPARFLRWLNSSNVQAVIVILLLVDVAVVAVELFLDAEAHAPPRVPRAHNASLALMHCKGGNTLM